MTMWHRRNLLLILCIALMCVSSAAASVIHVSGYEGRDVNVSCPYDRGYESYEKYLCKHNCRNDDVLITTSETNNKKYSMYDDTRSRIFTATISDLRSVDAGTYWCGVSRAGKDIYTEVKLQIIQDNCCDSVIQIQSHEEGSVSISCPYESQYQNNLKYMCRGKRPSTCLQQAVITSDNTHNAQFTLSDDKESRKFTVTVSSLTLNDSGSYLCGVHRNNGLDVFSAVELEVKEWCCVKSNNMSAVAGQPVTFRCPYPQHHWNYTKFLCKGDHHNNCTDMVTSQSRFTLQDNVSSSFFGVMITELEAGDAGTYWCGSDSQWSVGNYTKIQLSVVIPQNKEPSTESPEKHSKDATRVTISVYTLPVVLVLLLILTLVLFTVFKKRVNKSQGSGVSMNVTNGAEAGREMRLNHIYGLQEEVAPSHMGSSRPQSTMHHDGKGSDDQQCIYQNFMTREDINSN